MIKGEHGANLTIQRKWNDDTVNAYAYQTGSEWVVAMFGGLARRVTADGFLAVVCHETGHHLAGYPFWNNYEWPSANEGQADYFATLSCLRELLKDEDNSGAAAGLPAYPKAECDKAWGGLDDRNLCYRILKAGKSLADLLSNGRARYETPSKKVVSRTFNDHSEGQIRLDTYTSGGLCNASFSQTDILGASLGRQRNSAAGEQESYPYVCNGSEIGARPRSWFKSKL